MKLLNDALNVLLVTEEHYVEFPRKAKLVLLLIMAVLFLFPLFV